MTNSNDLFSPYALGPIMLSNRIVMAPLTRNRAPGPESVLPDRPVAVYGDTATRSRAPSLPIASCTALAQEPS